MKIGAKFEFPNFDCERKFLLDLRNLYPTSIEKLDSNRSILSRIDPDTSEEIPEQDEEMIDEPALEPPEPELDVSDAEAENSSEPPEPEIEDSHEPPEPELEDSVEPPIPLDTTQEIQNPAGCDTPFENVQVEHQIVPGPSGPAIQVCQLTDEAK